MRQLTREARERYSGHELGLPLLSLSLILPRLFCSTPPFVFFFLFFLFFPCFFVLSRATYQYLYRFAFVKISRARRKTSLVHLFVAPSSSERRYLGEISENRTDKERERKEEEDRKFDRFQELKSYIGKGFCIENLIASLFNSTTNLIHMLVDSSIPSKHSKKIIDFNICFLKKRENKIKTSSYYCFLNISLKTLHFILFFKLVKKWKKQNIDRILLYFQKKVYCLHNFY